MSAPLQIRDPSGPYRTLLVLLTEYVHESVARGLINHALHRTNIAEATLQHGNLPPLLLNALLRGVDLFLDQPGKKLECKQRLTDIFANGVGQLPAPTDAVIEIVREGDIVTARGRARGLAEQLGFNKTDQIKIATAISELARNIFKYVGTGSIRLEPQSSPRPGLRIVARDAGRGIANLDVILSGGYKSKTGLGLGILGCKKLMDEFQIVSSPETGTQITLFKAV